MRRIAVGIGNPLRRDDGVGPAVVEALRVQGLAHGWNLIVLEQDLMGLESLLLAHDLAVLVDAATGPTPGELVLAPLAGTEEGLRFSLHESDCRTEASYAREQGARAAVWLAGIGIESIGWGVGFSPAVMRALPGVTRRLAEAMEALARAGEAITR